MLSITKFPIIIFSSPRTGSGMLSNFLSKLYNLEMFTEIDENINTDEEKKFNNFIKSNNKNFVLKFHARKFNYYQNLNIFDSSYCIALSRKNIIDQIASHYIAKNRNKWHYSKNDTNDQFYEPIKIRSDLIQLSINTIKYANLALNNLSIKFDEILFYEDIAHLMNKVDIIPTPKPINFEELKYEIELNYSLIEN